jgi:hypothetical protein
VKAGVSGSRLAGPRCGNAPERPTQPGIGWCQASSGAKAPLACEDRQLEGRARTSTRLQKSASDDRGREKRAYPLATGHVDGGPAFGGTERARGGAKALTTSAAVAKPRRTGSPEPGARKGTAGRRSSTMEGTSDRHCRSARSRERSGDDLGGLLGSTRSASSEGNGKEATGVSEVRSTHTATGSNACRSEIPERAIVGPTKATRSAVKQTRSSTAGAKALDRSRTGEARVLVRRREMAEIGPTHRAS